MSSETSLECSMKFDSVESAEEQLKIFRKISRDTNGLLKLDNVLSEEDGEHVTIIAKTSGTPESHKIMHHLWRLIKHPEHVDEMSVLIENLEYGAYRFLSAHDEDQFMERQLKTEDVLEVVRRNNGDLWNAHYELGRLLGVYKI